MAARIALPALLLFGCMGNSSETTNGLSGVVVDGSGRGVAAAKVSLYREDTAYGFARSLADTARTDAAGRFRFSGLRDGLYALEATLDDSSLTVFAGEIAWLRAAPTPGLPLTASAPAALEGMVEIQARHPLRLALMHTPYAADPAPDGSFSFPFVPAGTYTLAAYLYDSTGTVSVIDTRQTAIVAGSKFTTDTLRPRVLQGTDSLTLDDFEDGDRFHNLGPSWWAFDDSLQGGTSSILSGAVGNSMNTAPGANGSGRALRISFRFGTAIPYFVGAGAYLALSTDNLHAGVDFSQAKTFSFWARGTGQRMRVEFKTELMPESDGLLLDLAQSPATWTRYAIDLDSLATVYDTADARHWSYARRFVSKVRWTAAPQVPGESGELWLDDIRFIFR